MSSSYFGCYEPASNAATLADSSLTDSIKAPIKPLYWSDLDPSSPWTSSGNTFSTSCAITPIEDELDLVKSYL